MEFDNHLHVLTHGPYLVASNIDDGILAKQSKSTGNNQVGVELVQQNT